MGICYNNKQTLASLQDDFGQFEHWQVSRVEATRQLISCLQEQSALPLLRSPLPCLISSITLFWVIGLRRYRWHRASLWSSDVTRFVCSCIARSYQCVLSPTQACTANRKYHPALVAAQPTLLSFKGISPACVAV